MFLNKYIRNTKTLSLRKDTCLYINIRRKILMIVCNVIRRKSEALIKRKDIRRTFFYPANKRARQLDDNSRFYRPRISPFQETSIFATKLLGYLTLVRFMVLT